MTSRAILKGWPLGAGQPAKFGIASIVTPTPTPVPTPTPSVAYDLILGPSDSFLVGVYARDAGDTLASNVYQFSSNTSDPAYRTINQNLPLSQPIARDSNSYLSVLESMANAHAARTGNPTIIIPYAWNGTNLASSGHRWQVGDDLHEGAIAQANAAIAAAQAVYPGSKLVAIAAWDYGGANDAIAIAQQQAGAATKASFKTALSAALSDFRSRITGAANVPIVLGSLVPEMIASYNSQNTVPYQSARDISDALAETARDGTNIKFVDIPAGNSSDNLHEINAGLRIVGPWFDAILADTTAPTISAPATVTASDGAPVGITVTANKYVTWSTTGPDGAAVEVYRTFGTGGTGNINSTIPTYRVRLLGNANANYASKSSYSFNLVARDGAGNVTITPMAINVAQPYGVGDQGPVTANYTGVASDGGTYFGNPTVPIATPLGVGLNLIFITSGAGSADVASLSFNGASATKLISSPSGVAGTVFSFVSGSAGTVTGQYTAGGGNGAIGSISILVVTMTGTKASPIATDYLAGASRNPPISGASLTCPTNGMIVGIGSMTSPTTAGTGCTAITVQGSNFAAYRTTTGAISFNGSAGYSFLSSLAFEKSV